ncbi:MAG: aldehyde ferredoxin oxidoreductase N-terminal domain-containing protein [Thermoprotei archaeon]
MTPGTYRVLFIDTGARTYHVKEYSYNVVTGPIDLGVKLHLYEYETWKKPVYSPDNVLVIGTGLLAGTKLYGVHRLVAVFKSPLTRGLHVAAMGGAAYQFRVGVHALAITGKSSEPLIIRVFDEGNGKPVVEFDTIRETELLDIWREYSGLKGIYALQKYLSEKYRSFYSEYDGRSILVGPASKYTGMGALASITLHRGEIDWGSEDFAARGGPGSVLYRAHGVAAIIYGGKYNRSKDVPEELLDTRPINELFTKLTGKPYITQVLEHGVKYRYDSKIGSGGTFGGNYPTLKIYTPMFNWNMIYLPADLREKLHGLIMKYMWEPFNKEAIETKSWKTCGEPCPLACKKVRLERYKSDYEPYNGLGPIIGIFDVHEIQRVVELVDAYGFDAIEMGNVIGFLFDALHKGLLRPGEIGVSGIPYFDPHEYKIEYSKYNADLAVQIVESMAWGRNPLLRLIGEKGLRSAAKILNILYEDRVKTTGYSFTDLPVYAVFGEEGHITPNYYWTPGMVAPLPVLGRYWTLYKGVFTDPEEFAQKAFERAIRELAVDNAGMCRFHRGWAEPVLDNLHKLYGVESYYKKMKKTYRLIVKYQDLAGVNPVFWDSRKIIDFMANAAAEYGNEKWSSKFALNKEKAAHEWWTKFYNKFKELLGTINIESEEESFIKS